MAPLTLSFWPCDDNLTTTAVLSRRRRVSIRHPPDAAFAGTANCNCSSKTPFDGDCCACTFFAVLWPHAKPTTLGSIRGMLRLECKQKRPEFNLESRRRAARFVVQPAAPPPVWRPYWARLQICEPA